MNFWNTAITLGTAFATGGTSLALRTLGLMALGAVVGGPGVKGPRVSDLKIALEGEGQELARGWGVWRQELSLVHTSGLIETKELSTEGDFFGIGGQEVTNYKYGVKCVLIGGRGPITRLRRLKLNLNAVYDWNGGDEQGASLVWNGSYWEGETTLKKFGKGIKIRVFPGTLNQPVGPVIVDAKGANQWTNYPSQWLVELEIPNLKKYGNSMPRVSVEVEYNVTALSDVILEIGSWVGLESIDFDLSALAGLSIAPNDGEGYLVDTRRKAADVIGELMDIYHFSLPEVDGVLRAVLRPGAPVFALGEAALRVRAGYGAESGVADAPIREADEEELSEIREFLFRDPAREYAPGYRFARRFDSNTKRKTTSQTNASMRGPRAFGVVRVLQAEEWAAGRGRDGTLGLEYLWLSAGDEGTVETPDGPVRVVLDSINAPLFGPLESKFVGVDPLVYNLPERDDTLGLVRRTPIEPGMPIVFAGENPFVSGDGVWNTERAYLVGVCRSVGDIDYSGAVINVDTKKPGEEWKEIEEREYLPEATIGELTAPWTPFVDDGFSSQVWGDALANRLPDVAIGRANIALFETGVVVLFETVARTGATVNSTFYSVAGVQSGVFGSDDFVAGALAAGTRFILLADETGRPVAGPRWYKAPSTTVPGTQMRLRINEIDNSQNQVTWDLGEFIGENIRLPSPLINDIAIGDGLHLSGALRSRFHVDYLGEPVRVEVAPQRYLLTLNASGQSHTIERTATGNTFDFTVSDSELTALFGGVPDTLTGTVAAYGIKGGLGRAREFEIQRLELNVLASSEEWTDTGITVGASDRVGVSATGTASHIPGEQHGPNGNADPDATENGFALGALVGVLMPSATAPTSAQAGTFLIGEELELENVKGRVWVRVNDFFFPDNTGSYDVTLQVHRT